MVSLDDITTVRVKRRTAHAINSIVGLDDPKTTADDIIWRALKVAFPDMMEQIERMQQITEEKNKREGK
jgi:hypothetical protein